MGYHAPYVLPELEDQNNVCMDVCDMESSFLV